MSKHLDDVGKPFEMEKFLTDSKRYIQLIPENDRRMIHNNIAFDLGLGEDVKIEDVQTYIEELSNPKTGLFDRTAIVSIAFVVFIPIVVFYLEVE
jgi:hypothetical protein